MTHTKIISLKSHNPAVRMMDITDRVDQVVESSKIKNGQVLIFARHTTAAVILQEDEPGIGKDLHQLLHGIAPKDGGYYHHNQSEDHQLDSFPNGHAHLQHILLGSSEIIPLSAGKMLLGQYQKIFLVELDRSRLRNIVVQVTGE